MFILCEGGAPWGFTFASIIAASEEVKTAVHMADALVSPVVGGAMWVASATLIGASAKKTRNPPMTTRPP